MNNILHATFHKPEAGIEAVEALLHLGVGAEEISLVLPESPIPESPIPESCISESHNLEVGQAGQATATVTPLTTVPSERRGRSLYASIGAHSHEAALDAGEGAGIGLGLGLLVALCLPGLALVAVPGIGLIAGSGIIIAQLMAGGALTGGILGGIYGLLIDRGVDHDVALILSNHLEGGGTTLSITLSEQSDVPDILDILIANGGHVIEN